MADVSAARNTKRKLSPHDMTLKYPMASTAGTIYQGTLVGVDTAGKALKASDSTVIKVVGMATKTITYAASTDKVEVVTGIFCFTAALSTAAPALANGDRWQPCYVLYDGTVTNDSGQIFAGLVEDVDSDGVYVLVAPWLNPQ